MKKKYITKLFILTLILLISLASLRNTPQVKSIYNSVIAPIIDTGGGGGGGGDNIYFQDAEPVTIGSPIQRSAGTGGVKYFSFRPQASGKYKIFSTGSTNVDGAVYDYSTRPIGSNNDINETDKNFCIFCNLQANTTYFVGVTLASGATSGSYTIQVMLVAENDDFGNDISSASIIQLDKDVNGKIEYGGDEDYFKFIPTQSAIYSIFTSGTIDTLGGIYDSNNNLIQENDNDKDMNFKITSRLEANKSYFIRVRHKSSTGTGPYTLRASLDNYVVSNKKEFSVVIAAANLKNNSQKTVTVSYNPNELEVVDLCSSTPQKELAVGSISGTNIEIKSYQPGTIVFNVVVPNKDGADWTGPLNTVRFKSKVNSETKVTYDIK